MLWRDKDDAEIIGYPTNHIDIIVRLDDILVWRLTGIFGEPNRNLRHNTWNLLKGLKGLYDLPWCVIGDFNNT